MRLALLAAIAGCTALIVLGVAARMDALHFVIAGLGLASCMFAASTPWITRSINNGLVRFTDYARGRVHERIRQAAAPALGRPVRWEFDDEGLRSQLLDVERRVAWSELKRLRILPKFWMFATRRDELMLPTAALTEPVCDFIRRKTAEAGTKIVDR